MGFYRLTQEADADLQEIVDYIGIDNPSAAWKILETIQEKLLFLGRHPQLTAPQKRFHNLAKHKIGNYLIFYRPYGKGIEVVRVLHASRDIDTILSKPH